MENNDYYEPTIKTSRKEYKEAKEQYGIEKDTLDKLKKCLCEPKDEFIPKQQLIKFLEDKIKEYQKEQDTTYGEAFTFYEGKEEACQEVLDFVNKGVKND